MKLLSEVILILAIILFPPATLALVSNDAVPGDATYPTKRGLENVIYSVASLNSATKAWFAAARSDRRFKEFSTLIAEGKSASNTLGELLIQTDVAVEEIKKVDDPIKKQELIAQLSRSIDKYNQKLDEVAQQVSTPPSEIAPSRQSTPAQIAVTTPIPSVATPKISPTPVRPTLTPVATPVLRSTETPRPSITPTPFSTSTLAPSNIPITGGEIDDAKKKFDGIRKKLEGDNNKKLHEENKKEQKQDEEKKQSDSNGKRDKKR